MSLIKSLGYRKTKCNTQHHVNSTTSNTKSKTLNTPWGKIVKPTKSEFLGMVEIQMSFDYNANILYVTIIQAKNLKSFSGNIAKPDAFILGYILPHRTMVRIKSNFWEFKKTKNGPDLKVNCMTVAGHHLKFCPTIHLYINDSALFAKIADI